jgi:protocatechuate 3,4-dioxygenase, alpha subunit
MGVRQTPSQIIGPFFGPALIRPGLETMVRPTTRGERVRIEGRVFDGDRAAVADAMIEIWQANAEGRYHHPEDTQEKLLDDHFHGFGRAATDEGGWYRFYTIKPGPVPGAGATLQAPHINVAIFARGLLKRLVTRIYFPDEPLNANDPVMTAVPPQRRATLIASAGAPLPAETLRFDIILQGENETVFFDII